MEDPESKVRVDLIFSPTPYETQAIKRSKRVKISNYSVRFASCEDVIIHKMVSGRAIDEEDIKSILTKNKVSLDHKYIRRWLWQFSKVSENSGIVRSFNDLLKKV